MQVLYGEPGASFVKGPFGMVTQGAEAQEKLLGIV